MKELHRIGVYGVGHFGFAMLRHLQRKSPEHLTLVAYDRDAGVRETLRTERRHPFHEATTPLQPDVRIADSLDELLDNLDAIVLAVTSNSTREVSGAIAEAVTSSSLTVINTAKALDSETGARLSELVSKEFEQRSVRLTYAALAGGTIASDLLSHEPLGMTIACEDEAMLPPLKQLLSSQSLWIESTTDLIGVEYAGAFKNVVSICAGMVRGLGHSYGSVTHLISRLAREIEELCVTRLGARRETFSTGSQCWGSDLWMSCTGETRNQALGQWLGQGMSLDQANEAMASQHKTVEGVQTLRAIRWLVERYERELPLLTIAKEIVLDGAPASRLISALMQDEEIV